MKIIKIVLAFAFSIIISIRIVSADEYTIRKGRYQNIYAVYNGMDRVHLFYGQWYSLNNHLAYCIEPGVDINTDKYYASEDFSITNLDDEVIKKIKLIAYYGFEYNTSAHHTDYYYLATQELIWRAITSREVYWVSEENINGNRINIDREKQVINNLVNNHNKVPSFTNQTYEINQGETLVLTDEYNLLKDFKLSDKNNETIITGNSLKVTPKKNTKIDLIRKSYTDSISLVYYNGQNQKLMSATGKLEPVIASFEIKVKNNPKIKVNKIDKESKKKINIKDIKFKIKNLDTNEYVCEFDDCIYKTNNFGEFVTDNLTYGNYQIEELDQEIKGYIWNEAPLLFTINDKSNYKEIDGETFLEYNFENTPVSGSIKIKKVGENPIYKDNLITYEEITLNDVIFNLYASEDILDSDNTVIYKKDAFIGNYKTENGEINIDNLPLGSYYLKEVFTPSNYILNKEIIQIKLEYIDQYTPVISEEITIKNYLKKGILEFTKTAFLSGIPLPDTLIEIYTSNGELILTDYTNELGKIILEGLPLGKYYIKEKEAPTGYTINSDLIYFEITENNQIIKANMIDELYKVPSTNLNKNYLIYLISLILFILGGYLFIHDKK